MTGLRISDQIGSPAAQSGDSQAQWGGRPVLETPLLHPHCVTPHTPSSAPCPSPAAAQKGRAPLEFSWSAPRLLLVWTQTPHQQAAQCSAQTLPPMMQCCRHPQPLLQTLRIWVQMNLSCWPNWRSRTGNSWAIVLPKQLKFRYIEGSCGLEVNL